MIVPAGYQFASVNAGVKEGSQKLDIALVTSDRPASAAGIFTTNRVQAAPVLVSKSRLPQGNLRGLVINSGNANACTGEQGLRDAQAMAAELALLLRSDPNSVAVCSTGVIGRPMPMVRVLGGIRSAFSKRAPTESAFNDVTRAIMTTDTCPKSAVRTLELGGKQATILGFAKGAAMIGPNMATMLAFVLTDAGAEPALLANCLPRAADRSFHCISVEGHTSTNDTLLLIANGASGANVSADNLSAFTDAVNEVCGELARAIIRDAEGANHFVTIAIEGAESDSAAKTIAKAIADSALVKTAIYGADPNWGRIVSAAGYAGVAFVPEKATLTVNKTELYRLGTPTPFDATLESKKLRENRECDIVLNLGLGSGRCQFWTSDLTLEYVHLNADYTT